MTWSTASSRILAPGLAGLAGLLIGVLLALTAGPAQAAPTAVTVSGPWGVTVDPGNDTAYVVSRTGNSLTQVSGTGVRGSSASLGSFPLGTAYNPVNGYVYTANYSGGSVSVINPATMSLVTTVSTTALGSVGANPYWVAVDQLTGNVVVSFYSAGAQVGVINPATQALTSLALPAGQSGDSHVGVSVDSADHIAYVSDSTSGLVDVVPLSGAAPTTMTVGGSPAGILYSAGKVYVGFASGSTLKVIDLANSNAVSSIGVGSTPSGVAVAPSTKAVFTTNNGDGTLSVIDGSSNTVVNSLTPGSANDYLTWAVVDDTSHRLYVGDFTAGKMLILNPDDTEATPTYTLTGSAPSVLEGGTVTYTATPSIATQPVTFYDGMSAISTCTNVAVTGGSATCAVTYPAAGSHSITAQSDEKTFLYKAAVSSAVTTAVTPTPVATTTTPSTTTPPTTTPSTTTPPTTTPSTTTPPTTTPAPTTPAPTTTSSSPDPTTTSPSPSQTSPIPTSTAPATTPPIMDVLHGPTLKATTGRIKSSFSGRLSATGGLPPYTFAIAKKALPPGLALSGTGLITGNPTVAGTYTPTLRVTDADGTMSDAVISFEVFRATADILPSIQRSGLLKPPAHPNLYQGKKRLTKAWEASADGTDAYPVNRLKGLNLVKGQAATLSGDGLFGFDRGVLTKAGRAQVRALAESLKAEATRVTCEGYTDYAGVRKHEVALSEQRARAVCAALVQDRAGVIPKSQGYGPAHPAVVGGSAQTRKENRRVVVRVTGQAPRKS